MAAEKQALRQQLIAQIDRCAELAYAAGHHFAEHGKHAPSSVMAKADADATLIRLIEEYAAIVVAHSKSEYKRRVALGDPNVTPPAGVNPSHGSCDA